MWTLVGSGVKTLEDSRRNMSDVIPPQADWLKTSVTGFHPEQNIVETADGSKIKYDYLIVAVGLKVGYEKVSEYVAFISFSTCAIPNLWWNSFNPDITEIRTQDNFCSPKCCICAYFNQYTSLIRTLSSVSRETIYLHVYYML